jgi:hypothetical protein
VRKTIRVYLEGQIIAENQVLLTPNEWVMLIPESDAIIGDLLWVEGGCDIDSIIFSWNGQVREHLRRQKLNKNMNRFASWKPKEGTGEKEAFTMV